MAGSGEYDLDVPLDKCEPTDWFVVFHVKSDRWWVDWLACGRFKHVSIFGHVPRCSTWTFFDWQLGQARIWTVADCEADGLIGHFSRRGVVVRVARQYNVSHRAIFRPGSWCVPTVAHILGLRACALRPDALFRHVLAIGGEIVAGETDGQCSETR